MADTNGNGNGNWNKLLWFLLPLLASGIIAYCTMIEGRAGSVDRRLNMLESRIGLLEQEARQAVTGFAARADEIMVHVRPMPEVKQEVAKLGWQIEALGARMTAETKVLHDRTTESEKGIHNRVTMISNRLLTMHQRIDALTGKPSGGMPPDF